MSEVKAVSFADTNLDKNPDVSPIYNSGHAAWLVTRGGGIGGSDAGAVMGLNKYKSPLGVYKDKTSEVYVEHSNAFTKKGHDLEPLIFEKYVYPHMMELGYHSIRGDEFTIVNRNYPWLRANCDGFAMPADPNSSYDATIILEIKTVSENAEVNWRDDLYCGVPASYYAQVQHYMVVTGTKKAIVCALFDSTWEVEFFEVPYDSSFVNSMLTKTKDFWYNNVLAKKAPTPSVSLDKIEFMEALDEPKPTYSSKRLSELVTAYSATKSEMKALETSASKMYDEIAELYLDGARPDDPTVKCAFNKYTRAAFDSTRFAAEHPEMYREFIKESTYTRATIKLK